MIINEEQSKELEFEIKDLLDKNDHIGLEYGTNMKIQIDNNPMNEVNVRFPFVEIIITKNLNNGYQKVNTALIPLSEIRVIRGFRSREKES